MDELKKIAEKTKEQNLIPQIQQIIEKRNSWMEEHPKISLQLKRFY